MARTIAVGAAALWGYFEKNSAYSAEKRIIMDIKTMQKDMVAAMKAKDKVRKDAVSSLISAVKKLASDEGKREDIDEELVDRAVLKEVKTAKEQVETCPAEREDLRSEYQARLDVIIEYAPKGVRGFVLGTTLLFGKDKSYGETLQNIRELKF